MSANDDASNGPLGDSAYSGEVCPLQQAFEEVLNRPESDRVAYVNQTYRHDPELRNRLLAFLEADAGEGVLDCSPEVVWAVEDESDLAPGTRIDRYEIRAILGAGGFGIVYRAEQVEPVRRQVALKVIKPGMDSKAVIARFEHERQALAVMDHPNVAKVLDAGTTTSDLGSRPYFVMEYVLGQPLTTFCDDHNLTIRQRLELFLQVCDAVQHAHMKGIIHRDIKPSNILVTQRESGNPVPMAIDFGVAKAISQELTGQTAFTEHGQIIGTPEYMSPEQADVGAKDIDTRTDVYSLGILLYELLTGALPFDPRELRSLGFAEMQRIIREVDPPRPSTRLSSLGQDAATVALHRAMRLDDLELELRRELEWVPLKAMRKDRTDRYRSASDLADDIRCYLDGRPLSAGPESKMYRLRKLVRRHRGPVAAGLIITLSVLGGIVGSTAFALQTQAAAQRESEQREAAEKNEKRALQAEAEAERRAGELERVVEFQASQFSEIDVTSMGIQLRRDLIDGLQAAFVQREPEVAGANHELEQAEYLLARINFTDVVLSLLSSHIFDRALATIDQDFETQPLVRAQLLQTMANVLSNIGLLDEATTPQDEALRIRQQELGNLHPDTLGSMVNAGVLLSRTSKYEEAEQYYVDALEGYRQALGDEHPHTMTALNNIGLHFVEKLQYDEAAPYISNALMLRRKVLGHDHADTLVSMTNMGKLLFHQRKFDEAEPYLRECLEYRREQNGARDPTTLIALANMGMQRQAQGDLESAREYFEEALAGSRATLGNEHYGTIRRIIDLAGTLHAQQIHAEAERLYREALNTSRCVLGPDHNTTLQAALQLASILRKEGSGEESLSLYQFVLDGRRRIHGDDHMITVMMKRYVARMLREMGRLDAALQMGEKVVAGARAIADEGHWNAAGFLIDHASTLMAMRRYDEAAALTVEAYELLSSEYGHESARLTAAVEQLVEIYSNWHAADPNEGFGAKADEWRDQLSRVHEPAD